MLSNHKGESVLDRAAVDSDVPDNDFTQYQETVDTNIHLSKRKRLSGKVKSLLHVSDDHVNIASNVDCVTLADSPDVIPGETRLDENPPPKPGPHGFQQAIQHPVDTFKAKSQRKTNKEVAGYLLSPEVTHAQDVALIHAQDTSDNAETESEKAKACEDLEKLKKARQDLFVRWTMDRHVFKVRRLKSNNVPEGRQEEPDNESSRTIGQLGWKVYTQRVRSILEMRWSSG